MNSDPSKKTGTVDCEGTRRLIKFARMATTENAVESTVQREGGEVVDGEELTGEVEFGKRRKAVRKRRMRREGRRASERVKEERGAGVGLFRLLEAPGNVESPGK